MIINRPGAIFEYDGVTYTIGEPIVGTAESEYEGLYGSITEIRDGEDKDTENETPDLYCEFDPPVLPCEIKKLEEIFSDLYDMPKTTDDIILDMVIMAPEMVRPLDNLHTMREQTPVYLVMEDWAVDGEHGNSCELLTDHDDAKRILFQKLQEEFDNGAIPRWSVRDNFVQNSTEDSYEGYIDGEYMEDHYSISIVRQPLTMSSQHIGNVGKLFLKQSREEDFATQIEGWDEVGRLTEAQHRALIHHPDVAERIESGLGKNDSYWEAYWETISEVAHDLIAKAVRAQDEENNAHPECYTPEADNPYPLCIGNGQEKCNACCLYVHMKGEGGHE